MFLASTNAVQFYWQCIMGVCFYDTDAVKLSCSIIECSFLLSFCLRVDGGVSSNDFVMQLTADLFGRKIARTQHREMSCLGAAFVAGLGVGMQSCRSFRLSQPAV